MKLFKKKSPSECPTRTEALAGIPEPSPTVTWKVIEDGDVLIEYPLQVKPFFIAVTSRFSNNSGRRLTKKLQLDTMGSMVWQMLDGKNTVKNIIQAVSRHNGLSLQEAEISVTVFLRELGRRGLILIR
ncbi:MAG: PqqD family protein [Desulforhopalus sp.]